MDTKQLNDALERIFDEEGERIVFWHDPEREFLLSLPFILLEDVEIIRLDETGGLQVKIRLEHQCPGRRFLLYSPSGEPDYEADWLLDIRLYSRNFRADRASILLDELGLENQQLRSHLAARRKFLDSKERLHKLANLVEPSDAAEELDLKMMAVAVKADQPEIFNLLRTLFRAFAAIEDEAELDLGSPPHCWDQIEKFDLAEPFWAFMEHTFAYREEAPTLRSLLIRLMITDLAHYLEGELPRSLDHLVLPPPGRSNAVVCLAQWRDSSSQGSSYDLLSVEVARVVHLAESLFSLEIEALAKVPTFAEVEQAVIRGLRDRILATAETLDRDEIRQLAAQRLDGHWSSASIPENSTVPRRAFRAVYQALLAAADLLSLRNRCQGGFDFSDAASMYRSYESELYRFDQLYRHFCEEADLAESQNWDVLKQLRERIEATYVNWYLLNQALAWGKFVDPEGEAALLGYWKIEGLRRQCEFYDQFVKPKLAEAERRRVFVIVSDAFRFEAAQELTQILNGQYRFEAQLQSQLGVLPSYTALGMASLLPHRQLSYKPNGDVLVDDRSTAGIEKRSEILATVDGMACKADQLIAMTKEDGRAFVADKRVVYIYHNAIDVVGESANQARTLQAVRKAIEELVATVNYVVNTLNGHYVLVTADHGFLFSETYPDETSKSPLKLKPPGTVKAKRRYLLGLGLPGHEAAWHGKTSATADAGGGMEFWIPRGANRFHFMGSKLFVHGGAMLQEIVVPVITVRQVRGKSAARTKTRTVSVQVLGSRHRITTNQYRCELLQMEPVGDRVKPVTLRVAVYEGDQPVTNVETVTFDSTSGNMDERKKTVRLALQGGQYDKRTLYRLVLREAETGIEQSSVEVTIERAFSDDF